MCIFVVLCVDETFYFYMYEYSDAIKLPKSYSHPSPPPPAPTPVVGRGYRLSYFCLEKR
jgi:hypothetical protein